MTAHNSRPMTTRNSGNRALGEALAARVIVGANFSPQARQFAGITIPMVAAEVLHRNGHRRPPACRPIS